MDDFGRRIMRSSKKILVLLSALVLAASLAGCSSQQKAADSSKPQTQTQVKQTKPVTQGITAPINLDEELAKAVKAEKIVSAADVYTQGDWVICSASLKNKTTLKQAKAVASKFVKAAKAAHKGKKAVFQFELNGKNYGLTK